MFNVSIGRRLAAIAALLVVPALVAASRTTTVFHLALKRAEPAVNDTVAASPKTLKLWFTESVSAATTGVRLMNAKDEVMKTSDVTVDAEPLSPAAVTVPEKLAAGTYVVMWRAMADDGHPSSGKFSFTVR